MIIQIKSTVVKEQIDTESIYMLNSLIITFNEKNKNEIIAHSTNENFKQYFLEEITIIKNNFREISGINVTWYAVLNGANLKIIYHENYSDEEKNSVLMQLTNSLNNKWYVNKVDYDLLDRTVE